MAYGTVNADVISTSVANTSLGAGNATVFKNRIINGDMRIDQRNAGASVSADGTTVYTLDRWSSAYSQNSKYTIQQNAGAVTPPVGFVNYLGCTSSAATTVGASDYFLMLQKIEGLNFGDLQWGTVNAKTVTLSFWVRSSLTGTFGGSLKNSAGNRSYPFTYTINSANTWEYETITIAGDTTGTWLTTNGIGVQLTFSLGSGSTFSGTAGAWAASNLFSATGATSVVGTNGATFYITGVQLEVGTSATGFEYRDYGNQLVQCQRYCQQSAGTAIYDMLGIGFNISSTDALMDLSLPVKMRTLPTLSYSNVVASDGNNSYTVSGITVYSSNGNTQQIRITVTSSGYTQYRPCYLVTNGTTSATFVLSAEL